MRDIIAADEGIRVNMRRHPLLLWTIALIVMTLFACLGFWQLERADQKREMLAKASAALSSRAPQSLSVIADHDRAADYDWVEVEGGFIDAPTVLLDNQQQRGRVGVRAYRVFVLKNGLPVLVDLGWTPLPPDRTLPVVKRDLTRATLAGLMLPPPGHGLDVGAPAIQSDGTLLATTVDLQTLGAMLRLPALAPRVLRPEHDSTLGYARDFDILPNTLPPERHLGYAVQWFGLAITVLITALLLTFRRKRT
jgi:surfeit locus 1 family protein